MASLIQRIYWRLPYFAKCWIASHSARKSGRFRYGPQYELFVKEISERDSWSAEQFAEYQQRELQKIVGIAAANTPYYRKLFSQHGIAAEDIRGLDDLQKLPILEKETVRTHSESMVDETRDRGELTIISTSGTTGTPLGIYRSAREESMAFALGDARSHAVAGMCRRRNRSVSLGGQLVAAPNRSRPPFWVLNRRWNQLYMSSYHLAPDHLRHYVDALRRFGPEYMEGYPSSVYAIARHIIDNSLPPVPMKACFTTAEALFDYHRQAIREAFGCRTYDQYGCGEQVVFAAECEAGSMHLSPEVGIVEVVDDDDRVLGFGQTGKLVCTGLVNRVHPFIRYRLGDLGALSSEPCSCGGSLPVLASMEGRIDAAVVTRDGRRISRLGRIFKGAASIAEAQIVQDDYDKFRIRIVPAGDYTDEDGRVLIDNLAQRVGRVDISVETVDEIERTANGKFRAVVCNLPEDKRM